MSNNLIGLESQLAETKYSEIKETILKNIPVVNDAIANFGKSQSQYMDNYLTVSHPTPLRNARQMLAEINRIKDALRDNFYSTEKTKLELAELEASLIQTHKSNKQKRIELDIAYKKACLLDGRAYVDGALRSLANYMEQYNHIMAQHGYDKMTEAEFEKEEHKYHVMKAFEQAVTAARSRGGLIDEGNHGYLAQLGINGGMAQHFVSNFLRVEEEEIHKGNFIDGKFLFDFLTEMAKIFENSLDAVKETRKILGENPNAILDR